jgi:hypothetical protein
MAATPLGAKSLKTRPQLIRLFSNRNLSALPRSGFCFPLWVRAFLTAFVLEFTTANHKLLTIKD